MDDNYFHGNPGLMYIEENIPGPSDGSLEYEMLIENFNSQLFQHCNCTSTCVQETCECLQAFGGVNYIEFEDKLTLNEHKDFRNCPIIECNKLCKCSETCGNRLIQKGPLKTLYVKVCENKTKGLGLFSNTFVPRGTFICEYAGEVITSTQALQRYNINRIEGRMNYIFCLNEHGVELIRTFVDPSIFGNIGRYINHSCNPSCKIISARVDSPVPKLAIFSSVDINSGEEITFNYGSSMNTGFIDQRKKCLCNSSQCCGLMPFEE